MEWRPGVWGLDLGPGWWQVHAAIARQVVNIDASARATQWACADRFLQACLSSAAEWETGNLTCHMWHQALCLLVVLSRLLVTGSAVAAQ
jgi:hypothetical protein